MKSLKTLLTLILVIPFYLLKAQNSEDCLQNLSIFAEYAKVKNYDSAYDPWVAVKNECPDLNSAIYIYGERILKDFIKNSEGDKKVKFQSDLINLYDEWLTYFPKTKSGKSQVGKILAIKGQSMVDYKLAKNQEVFEVFDQAFKKDQNSFTSPPIYQFWRKCYTLRTNYKFNHTI